MKTNRARLLMLLLPVILVIVPAAFISFLSTQSIRQQFDTGNELQSQDLEVLVEAARLSEQMSQIHISLEDSVKEAISGRISAARLYRVHANAVNSLNRITERVKTLSQSKQLMGANPQDGVSLLDHFEKYRNLVIMTSDVSSIDPKAAIPFVDQAQVHFHDYSEIAFRISALLADRIQNLNNNNKHQIDSIYNQITLYGSIGMLGIFLLSAFAARLISSRIINMTDDTNALPSATGVPP